MLSNEYKANESDKCMCYKNENNICTIICLYVRDLLTFGSKIHVVNYVKSLLINNIDKKYLDKIEVILGFKITGLEKRFFFYEFHKVEKILRKYNYLTVNLQAYLMIHV